MSTRSPAPPADPLVCFCMKVQRGVLVAAIGAGARTLAALQDSTRAGTGCGTCRIDLLELLAEHGDVVAAGGPQPDGTPGLDAGAGPGRHATIRGGGDRER